MSSEVGSRSACGRGADTCWGQPRGAVLRRHNGRRGGARHSSWRASSSGEEGLLETVGLPLRLLAVVVRHARLLGADFPWVMMLAGSLQHGVRLHHQCGRAVSGALDRTGSDRGWVATDDGDAVVECAEQTGLRTRTACSDRCPATTCEPCRCPSRGLRVHASAAVCTQGAGHDAHSNG